MEEKAEKKLDENRGYVFSDFIAILCRLYSKEGLRTAGQDPLKRRFVGVQNGDDKPGEGSENSDAGTQNPEETTTKGGCPVRPENLGLENLSCVNSFKDGSVGFGDLAVMLILCLMLYFSMEYGKSKEVKSCPAGYEAPQDMYSMLNPFLWRKKADGPSPQAPLAVTVIKDANIWTGAEPEFVEAMGVDDLGRIVSVGSLDDVLASAVPNPTLLGMEGQFVAPGFIDSHVHLFLGGLSLTQLDLRPAGSRAEVRTLVAAAVEHLQPGAWLQGTGWDHERWGGELPSKEWLDDITPHNPVWLTRIDSHQGLANSLALSLAGINAATHSPDGGVVVKEADSGEPTGLLQDNAMTLVQSLLPAPSEEDRTAALQAACMEFLSHGITSVHDMGDISLGLTSHLAAERIWADLQILREADKAGDLPVRVRAYVPVSRWRDLAELQSKEGTGGDRVTWGGVKGFMDGSLGSRTALLGAAYTDAPETSGLRMHPPDLQDLTRTLLEVDRAGIQIAMHAIGDLAVDELVGVYERVRHEAATSASSASSTSTSSTSTSSTSSSKKSGRGHRFRIEHAQHVSGPDAVRRIAELDAHVSVQPGQLAADQQLAERRLGPERARWSYPFKSLVSAGVTLAGGSDWTVTPLNVLNAITAAQWRIDPTGPQDNQESWIPEERLTAKEALRAYTQGAAAAGFQENTQGILKAGAYADFVVLSDSPLDEDTNRANDVTLRSTYVGGECKWGCSTTSGSCESNDD